MIAYLLRRILLTIPTFVALMFATFVAIRLVPGDPVEVRVGEHGISPERLAMFRHELGLDLPVWRQFLVYVWQLLHGDFGTSLSTQQKVLTEFLTLFPATLELSFFAMMFALLIGVPAGAIAAVKRGGYFDQALMTIATVGYSMPIFWWGLLLIMFVALTLGLTPVSGRIDLIQYYFDPVTGFMTIDALLSDQPGAFLDALHHLVLPAIVLGTIPLAVIARMTRSSMLEVLSEDYVRTARAKGLSPLRVIGLQTSALLAGAVLTETIFSWPGVGKWLIDSISRRDYPALQGGVMLVSSVVIVVNLMVDLLYGAINPRIRHGR
jgi:dipeptide transport system permease protein